MRYWCKKGGVDKMVVCWLRMSLLLTVAAALSCGDAKRTPNLLKEAGLELAGVVHEVALLIQPPALEEPYLTRKWILNKDQRLIEEQRYDTKGELSRRLNYYYDRKGNLIEVREQGGTGVPETVLQEYRYNTIGRIAEVSHYNADGTLRYRTLYTYDTEGQLVEERSLDFAGNLVRRLVRRFEQGQESQRVSYSAVGDVIAHTAYTYDEDVLIKTATYDTEGVLQWVQHQYFDDLKRLVSISQHHATLPESTPEEAASEERSAPLGRLLKRYIIYPEEVVYPQRVMSGYEDGRITEETYDAQGVMTERTVRLGVAHRHHMTFTRNYDTLGNWITERRLETLWDEESGQSSEQVSLHLRQITYYCTEAIDRLCFLSPDN